ncbi:class II aldolase/adducin family protein [Candidatus Micrarchaeota archaeon]|nr:class II aldolase/adducin family protein [Candidatus Micrarchaeota archaeon]
MGEEYKGAKFSCKITGGITADDSRIEELLQIDSALKEFLHPNKNEGNLSVRTKKGFLIKGAGEKLTKLNKDSLSHVISAEESSFFVIAEGKTPSSESFMHHFIYENQPEINAILHFHDDSLLEKAKGKFPEVPELPYGSMELAREASGPRESIITLKNHGFLLKAQSPKELPKMLKELYELR